MITLIVLTIVVVIVGVLAEVALFKHRETDKTLLEWEKEYSPFFQAVEELKGFGGNLLEQQQKPDVSEPFKAWAAKSLGPEDKVLKEWLIAMPEPGLNALTQKLADFCAELNLDLTWLVGDQLELTPKLKETMREVVVSYCWGCWKAVQVQPEIGLFRTYLAVVQDPTAKTYQAVSQQLLIELRKHDLTPEPDPGWFLAPEKERREYISQVIRQASEKDRTKFYAIFQEIIATNGSTHADPSETPPPSNRAEVPEVERQNG